MGKCLSTQFQDQLEDQSSQKNKSEEESIKNVGITAPKKIQKGKNKYKSSLLNSQLNRQIIFEEESYAISSAMQSIYFEDLEALNKRLQGSLNSIRQTSQLLTINQKQIMRLYNIGSQSYLHSHVVKYESGSKQNEVCACKDGQHDYDSWLVIADHNEKIQDQNIVLFNHMLTGNVMRADPKYRNEKSNQYQVSCVNSLEDLKDEDYWKIEFYPINPYCLTLSKYVLSIYYAEIKHVQTDSYLQVTNNHAIIKSNLEVGVGPKNDQLDYWQIQEID